MLLKKPFAIVFLSFVLVCGLTQAGSKPVLRRSANVVKGKWISLFDGKTLNGWHIFNHKSQPANWTIEDGSIVCRGFKGPSGSCDLVTDRAFENFELQWEWMVNKGTNSGVFYHVLEGEKYRRPSEISPEYQLIDDPGFAGKLEDDQKTAADYGMYAPTAERILKPAGEWNTSKIVFNKGHVEYWLNGKPVLTFEAWSDDWLKRKAAGKWNAFPDYGLSNKGSIGLQDHNDGQARFRKIKIREL